MPSIHPVVQRNEKVVREFIRGWETRDLSLALAQVTNDMCYLNQPLEAIRGRENVAKMIGSIIEPAKKVEFKLLNLFGLDNTPGLRRSITSGDDRAAARRGAAHD